MTVLETIHQCHRYFPNRRIEIEFRVAELSADLRAGGIAVQEMQLKLLAEYPPKSILKESAKRSHRGHGKKQLRKR
jgi:hypothetical protein